MKDESLEIDPLPPLPRRWTELDSVTIWAHNSSFHAAQNEFFYNLWTLGFHVVSSSRETLTIFDRAAKSVQSRYAMCAISLRWIRRQQSVCRWSQLSTHLTADADAAA